MNSIQFFADGWAPLVRILLIGTLGYLWLVLLLRGTGPRTLARMTPFDFVITVTLGSAFGRVLTATEVSLAEALVTFALLVALQWAFAAGRARWRWFANAVDTSPVLVWHDGSPVRAALEKHRLTESDLDSAAREKGFGTLDDVAAIVLQSDGQWAVVGRSAMGAGTTVPASSTR